MTEQEILNKVDSEGWTVIETKTISTEGAGSDLQTYIGLLIIKPSNSVMLRKWVNYVKLPDGSCYWREVDPFPVKPETFNRKLRTAISNYISAGQIKAGYVERMNQDDETALVVVITAGDEYKTFFINPDGSGGYQKTEVTGAYPFSSNNP